MRLGVAGTLAIYPGSDGQAVKARPGAYGLMR